MVVGGLLATVLLWCVLVAAIAFPEQSSPWLEQQRRARHARKGEHSPHKSV